MKISASDIVRAAVDAAIEELKKHNLFHDVNLLPKLFLQALYERSNTVQVVLVTPSGEAGPAKEGIAKALEKALSRPVQIEERADPKLMGGASLIFDNRRIDFSLRGSLNQLEAQLKSVRAKTPHPVTPSL